MHNTSAVEHFADAATVKPSYTDADNLEGGRVDTRHLSDAREHDSVPVYVLPVTYSGNLDADDVNEANHRFLAANYGEQPWLVRVDYAWGKAYAIAPHLIPEDEDVEQVCELILDDYPVYDDDVVTEVQMEWFEEQVEGWMSADLRRELPEDVDRSELGDIIRAWYEDSQQWLTFEGGSVYIHRDDWANLVEYATNKLRGA